MATTKALGILLAVIVVIGAYLAVAGLLGIAEYWAGFLFLLQWSMMEGMRNDRLPASVLGGAAGIAIAGIPAWASPLVGIHAALALLTAAALAATFLFIKGWLPILVNAATMLFLTVATIPHIAGGATPSAILLGLALGVIFFGGLALVASTVQKARGTMAPASEPAA